MAGAAIAPQVITGLFTAGAAVVAGGLAFVGGSLIRSKEIRAQERQRWTDRRVDAVSAFLASHGNSYMSCLKISTDRRPDVDPLFSIDETYRSFLSDYTEATHHLAVLSLLLPDSIVDLARQSHNALIDSATGKRPDGWDKVYSRLTREFIERVRAYLGVPME